ncbi:hypothetical protein [Allobranchiibius sp. GilTou38]|uniref:hypothetical protein n=1 Tax=Allobranchiibius sp. GilTou38 TaxID=2815210 RepID=UPI001AA123FE|nr:hypothetical protein [Allobranchiibius sp. GilTou38]MBO1768234.1 hypothetical protein [Allobranchiibius sp. GilTou38]
MNPDTGIEYAGYIEAELATERERTDRLLGRATRIQQLGGAVVTVFAALLGAFGRGPLRTWSGLVFAAFVVSVAAALVASLIAEWSRSFEVSDAETFNHMTTDKWNDPSPHARLAVARARADAIKSLRAANNKRVGYVDAGNIAVLVALVLGATESTLRATGH